MGLKEALANIEKRFGKASVMKLGAAAAGLEVETVPTGILPLDVATGVGGLPKGRIVEIFGPESGGKSSLLLSCMAEVQRAGGTVAFVDSEQALDPSWAKTLGVNVDSMYVSQPDNGEQAMEIAEELIRSGDLGMVAVDSVATLVPRAEIEGEMGDSHVGLQARLMSQALRKLVGAVHQTKTLVVFTNQLREKIGVFYGNPEVTTGGRALKFYASLRIDLRQIASEDMKREEGARIRAKIVKNKVAPPFRQCEFTLLYGKGFDREDGVLSCGVDFGVVKRSGSHYSLGEMKIGRSRDEAKQFLADNPEVSGTVEKTVRDSLRKKAE